MVIATANRVVKHPKDDIWKLFCDLPLIAEYHPFVNHVHVTNPNTTTSTNNKKFKKKRPAGIGTFRYCHFYDGTSTKEEIIQLVAKDYLVWKVQEQVTGQEDEEELPGDDAGACEATERGSVNTRHTGEEDDDVLANYSCTSSIVKEMYVKYSAISVSETRTEIRIDATFDMPPDECLPKLPWFIRCFNSILILRRILFLRNSIRRLDDVLHGMDMHLKTGERVDMTMQDVSR